jgi:hypothetical protein
MSITTLKRGQKISYRFHDMNGDAELVDIKNNGNVITIRDTRVFVLGDVIRLKLMPYDEYYQVMEQKGCYITLWSN